MQCAGVERMRKYLDWAREFGLSVRRALADGAVVAAACYGTTYCFEPGYAEIFLDCNKR